MAMDENETQVSLLFGRVILACLAVIIAIYGLDVPLPVMV